MQPKTRSCQTCVFPEQARKRPRPPFLTPRGRPPSRRATAAGRSPRRAGRVIIIMIGRRGAGGHAASRDRPWPWTQRRPPAQSQALNSPKTLTPCVIHIAGYSMRKVALPALCPAEQPLASPAPLRARRPPLSRSCAAPPRPAEYLFGLRRGFYR